MVCLILPFVPALSSQPFPSQSTIDRFIGSQWNETGVPGISVAIVENGRIAYVGGFGLADVENQIPASPHTVYRIGSITKQFTATMIMQLVQEGKIQLDETLGILLPNSPKPWQAVTVRQLLNHTAGIPSYTAVPNFLEFSRQNTTTDHINDAVINKPLDFEPGSKWSYSNSGYILLGLILEKIEGKPYRLCLQKRILDPLGMSETYFCTDADLVKRRAMGYSSSEGKLQNASYINMVWPFAAGGIESTVLDLAKWDASLYGDKILGQNNLAQMWQPTTLSDGRKAPYGFGWAIGTSNEVKIMNHSGGINGFTSYIQRAPSIGTTVIVLTNWDTSDPVEFGTKIARFVDPRLQEQTTPIPDKDPVLTARLTAALKRIVEGEIDSTEFSIEMNKVLNFEVLSSFKGKSKVWGPFQSIRLIKSTDQAGLKLRKYLVKFKNADLIAGFTMGSSGQIEGFVLHP